jgi:hypothetical protein
MKLINNDKGIALVTSLMFTVLALVMCMSLLYLITMSTKTSGTMKRYRTALEAAQGGTDLVLKDIFPAFHSYSGTALTSRFTGFNSLSTSLCLRIKLKTPKSEWPNACRNFSLNAKESKDVAFNLNGASINGVPGTPYRVYAKIVDTVDHRIVVADNYSGASGRNSVRPKTVVFAGNSDVSESGLNISSVTQGKPPNNPHYPYLYRVEVQGERQINAVENSKLSVLYAY